MVLYGQVHLLLLLPGQFCDTYAILCLDFCAGHKQQPGALVVALLAGQMQRTKLGLRFNQIPFHSIRYDLS